MPKESGNEISTAVAMRGELIDLIGSADFPARLTPENISEFDSKISGFNEAEISELTVRIKEKAAVKKKSGSNILISSLEDIAALTKMELLLFAYGISETVVNTLLETLVQKSSEFSEPIFSGKVNELYVSSVQNAIITVVLEKTVESQAKNKHNEELKNLIDEKLRDTETFVHLVDVIDHIKIDENEALRAIFSLNLILEGLKREETMRKSESIRMKDLINLYLLSKIQLSLLELGFSNETLEGIIINRLSQSNNVRRQMMILNGLIEESLSGKLFVEQNSKTEKLEWLTLLNEREIATALQQYEDKLRKDKYEPLDAELKEMVRDALMTGNIADSTISAISFARRLDNPDESLHDPTVLVSIAQETQYLTSLIYRVRGFQIKEVYEFVEIIGELDLATSDKDKIVENFKEELNWIDKSILKENDSEIKKAALASGYLSARLLHKFGISTQYLKLTIDDLMVDRNKCGELSEDVIDDMELQVVYFNELRKRIGLFNKAERAFLTMNAVEKNIDEAGLCLDKDGSFKIFEAINEVELRHSIKYYIDEGTITAGDNTKEFSPQFAFDKISEIFTTDSVMKVEKEAVSKSIIPESILSKASDEGRMLETVLDIKNYAMYLLTRRFDKPEYPRHLERAINLITALIEDAIGWRHFEDTQIRAKKEIVPLLNEYYEFLSTYIEIHKDNPKISEQEYFTKLKEDDFFAFTDMKDSLEGGKKSASQIKAEFYSLVLGDRFENCIKQSIDIAISAGEEKWAQYKEQMGTVKQEVLQEIEKSTKVIATLVEKLTASEDLSKYKDTIGTLKNRYLKELESIKSKLADNRKPPSIAKLEFERITNSEKFKVFIKNSYELTQQISA